MQQVIALMSLKQGSFFMLLEELQIRVQEFLNLNSYLQPLLN